jgi:hypothetical protein
MEPRKHFEPDTQAHDLLDAEIMVAGRATY